MTEFSSRDLIDALRRLRDVNDHVMIYVGPISVNVHLYPWRGCLSSLSVGPLSVWFWRIHEPGRRLKWWWEGKELNVQVRSCRFDNVSRCAARAGRGR